MSANKSMSRSRWWLLPALGCAWRFRSGLWNKRGKATGPLHHFLTLLGAKTAACSLALFLPTCTFRCRIRRAAAAMDGWRRKEGSSLHSFLPSCLHLRVVPSIPPSPHVSTTFHFRMGDPSVLSLHKTLEEMGEMHRRKQHHSERGSTELC